MSRLKVNRVLLSGSFFTALGEIVAGISGLVTSIVAARVLSPRDFGLMATVILALSILEHFSQTGFDSALVQKQSDVEPYLDVAWTWHLVRGIVITGVLALAAAPLAHWYDEPMLLPLMLACCGSAVLIGAHNVGPIFFTRQLDFKTLFYIKAAHTGLKLAVFLPAVLIFRNVWALVIGHVVGAALGLVISYLAHPYRPKLSLDRSKLSELVGFGKWLTGMAWIGFVIGKGDDVFVSKYIGIAALGVYQFAYNLSNMPTTNITHVIGRIGLPTYARLLDDRDELRATFIKVMRVTLLSSGPVTVFIYVTIPDLVSYVVGEKWAGAIPLVRILVISGFVRSFAALAGPLFQATGRPDLDFKMNLPRFVCTVGLIWPFCALWGLEGACWVVLIAICTCLPTWIVGLRSLIDLKMSVVLRENALSLLASASLAACLVGARTLAPPGALWAALAIGGGLALWLLADLLLGALTQHSLLREIRQLLATIRQARIDAAERQAASV